MSKLKIETFLEDIKDHKMDIVKDDGVFRIINFSKPGTSSYYYQLVTFPIGLLIRGDMGEYYFERTKDMFNFFRRDRLEINSYYWEEKCLASKRGTSEYSDDVFKNAIDEYVADYIECNDLDEEDSQGLIEEVNKSLTGDNCYHSDNDAREALDLFESDIVPDFKFVDMFDYDFTDFKYHFEWCLFAIVHGIMMYDKEKSKNEIAADN